MCVYVYMCVYTCFASVHRASSGGPDNTHMVGMKLYRCPDVKWVRTNPEIGQLVSFRDICLGNVKKQLKGGVLLSKLNCGNWPVLFSKRALSVTFPRICSYISNNEWGGGGELTRSVVSQPTRAWHP